MWLTGGSGLNDVTCDWCTALIPTGPMQGEGGAIPRNKGFSWRAWGSLGRQKWWIVRKNGIHEREASAQNILWADMSHLEGPTFSRSSRDVGLHLRAISECFGPDAIVIRDAIGKVFDLHPQGSAALHIYCHNLTDTWSARRGVCTGNTKTLDTAFYKRQIA